MKTKIILIAVMICSVGAFAQGNQIENKKGVKIMPEQGDFGVGINALPVLMYIGDLFGSGSNNTALGGNKFTSVFASNTLYGKYMLTENTAIRGHLRIGVFNNTFRNELDDDGQVDPNFMLTDVYKRSSSVYNIGGGYEWRRGTTRLRGLYGGELFYQHVQGLKGDYSYGNRIQEGNEFATSTVWGSGGNVEGEFPVIERILSTTGGNYNGIGLRAFAGVEYFIAPKICIGTEFGWGATYGTVSSRETVYEFWDTSGDTDFTNTRSVLDSGSSSLRIDTDNFNGAIYFMFYF
mgnify:CR=1 FL=1